MDDLRTSSVRKFQLTTARLPVQKSVCNTIDPILLHIIISSISTQTPDWPHIGKSLSDITGTREDQYGRRRRFGSVGRLLSRLTLLSLIGTGSALAQDQPSQSANDE
jgi:hypothetical protein